jgi:hypothetical protein
MDVTIRFIRSEVAFAYVTNELSGVAALDRRLGAVGT